MIVDRTFTAAGRSAKPDLQLSSRVYDLSGCDKTWWLGVYNATVAEVLGCIFWSCQVVSIVASTANVVMQVR